MVGRSLALAASLPARAWSARSRAAASAALAGAALGAVIALVFLVLAYVSLMPDRSRLAARVTEAFAERTLRADAGWELGDTGNGAHQYNDCLILYQALDDRAPALLRALSPLAPPVDDMPVCRRLAPLAAGAPVPASHHYHQYLHAHTTLARLLAPDLGVAGMRGLLKLLATLALLAGAGFAAIALAAGRRSEVHAAWLCVFLLLARWFGLESFGQSLSHGPADLVILGFLLWLSRAGADAAPTRRALVIAAGLFGALTMQFEFLTGGLPLGLAAVIGGIGIVAAAGRDAIADACAGAAAFLAAAAATVVVKLTLVVLMFRPAPLIGIVDQLVFRAGLTDPRGRGTPVDTALFGRHIIAGFEGLAAGMPVLAIGTFGLAVAGGVWGWRRLAAADDRVGRDRATLLAASALVPPLWIVLLWQHSAEHAWFVDRILVWPIVAGALLFLLAVCDRYRARYASGPGTAR